VSVRKKARERKRESTSTAERGETYMETKREVNKACRSVLSQWYHSGDATSNTERERREKERKKERKRERKRERERERERKRERDREREREKER